MNPILINDPNDERVADYCLLKHKETIRDRFIADHERTVIRLLESDLEKISLFCTEKYLDRHRSILATHLPDSAPIYLAEEEVFLSTVGYPVHRGFLGVGRIPQDWQMDWMPRSESNEITKSDAINPPRAIIATNEIADAENLGSIIRTSTALGVHHILTDEFTCSPYLRRCVRVSMGNLFYSRIRRSNSMKEDLVALKELGYTVIGLSLPRKGREFNLRTLDRIEFPEHFVLILGNEANGIHSSIQDLCDLFLTIPMNPAVDSLNVSHALAVALGQYSVKLAQLSKR